MQYLLFNPLYTALALTFCLALLIIYFLGCILCKIYYYYLLKKYEPDYDDIIIHLHKGVARASSLSYVMLIILAFLHLWIVIYNLMYPRIDNINS